MPGGPQQIRVGQQLTRFPELVAQLIAVRRHAKKSSEEQEAQKAGVGLWQGGIG
jgi:hypothetical protein